MNTIFNNRELAVGIWIIAFAIWVLVQNSFRQSFYNLLKAFFVKRIIILFALMFTYIGLITWFLETLGIWDLTQLKNTIIWAISVAAVTMFRIRTIADDEHYYKNAILDNLKLIVILEFIINIHSFSLLIELIVIPFAAITTGVMAFSENNKKYKQAHNASGWILTFIGIGLLGAGIYNISISESSFATINNLIDFILPPLMSAFYLPFVYLVALLMTYEVFFIRLSFFAKDPAILKHSKLTTLLKINFRLQKLKTWGQHIIKVDFSSKESFDRAINEFNT